MEFTHSRTVKIIAVLLLLAALSQPMYTGLSQLAPEIPRKMLWSFEALIFVMLLPFAGSALAKSKRFSVAFSAIAFSAVLNVIQIGIGLTQFGPFRAVAQANRDLGGLASGIVKFSFFGYNAAKMLLGFAAFAFGMALLNGAGKSLSKPLGILAVIIGIAAFVTNAAVMMFGIQNGIVPRPLAGGTGVAAAVILGICLLSLEVDDEII